MPTPRIPRARGDEFYVALSDTTTVFPALIDTERWNGFVMPRFSRDAAEAVAGWLNENHGTDAVYRHFTAAFDGVALLVTDTSEGYTERIEPENDRYPIGAGAWIWELASPAPDESAEAALLADTDRLKPQDGEILVTINLFGNGIDPKFPALPDALRGWSRAGTPRLRPEVAKVVVAWLNDCERRYPGGVTAYWDDATIVLVDWLASKEDGYLPTRIARADDGRYAIGADFEWERADNDSRADGSN